jgi:SAM-dependent methyltransferase
MESSAWVWDASLYAGSAPHYVTGRVPYPAELADAIRDELGLDGAGRLLDVGCGPGKLTTLLAPMFTEAVGVDADPGMIEVARAAAPEIDWRVLRAEDLPAGLGRFRALTFAQSFHWMEQPVVARAGRRMLEPGGAWVRVNARTHAGDFSDDPLHHPRPPWEEVRAVVRDYLGPVQRAGRGTLPPGPRERAEDDVMRAEGWSGPARRTVRQPEPVVRTVDEVVSSMLSLSGSAPHLFGDRLPDFVRDLRAVLSRAAPDGLFAERLTDIDVKVWRP